MDRYKAKSRLDKSKRLLKPIPHATFPKKRRCENVQNDLVSAKIQRFYLMSNNVVLIFSKIL